MRPRDADGSQVVVGTWGGDYGQLLSDIIDKPLMAPKGFEIVQDVANADPRKTKLLAERQSRRGSMDVACLSDSDMYIVEQAGAFDPVDAKQVTRLDKVFPELRNDIAIPHIYSAQVILYNTNQVKTPPQSFADLWDPKWRGRVGLADILYPNNTLAGGAGRRRQREQSRSGREEAIGVALARREDLSVQRGAGCRAEIGGGVADHDVAGARLHVEEGRHPAGPCRAEGGRACDRVPGHGAEECAGTSRGGFAYLDAMLDAKAQVGFADKMGYVPTVTDAVLPADLATHVSLTEAERARLLKPD